MKIVVITGSTRGIGYGLANSFLALGCAVVFSGRSITNIDNVVEQMGKLYDPTKIYGVPCDITDFSQVLQLWDKAKAHFGKIDIWINNAGITHISSDVWELPPDQIKDVIETNLLGTFYGSKVAIQGMLEQGFGSLYNMEGMGSEGRKTKGLTIYGTSKYAVRYLTQSLILEAKKEPVIIGTLSPGIALTELITRESKEHPDKYVKNKRIFNILGDRVETIAPWMAKKILENGKSGARIAWLTPGKVFLRFVLSPFNKRDIF